MIKNLLPLLLLALLLCTTVPPVQADERISLDLFYDNLETYGVWQEVGDYGYCWQPHQTEADWRPYSDGRWVYTEAGWTWDSDEPFGWAVYHYGRWANASGMGWIWIPGIEWGPGWVSWRHSQRYVGWAPLPPEAHFRRETGFHGWVDDYYDIGPSNYCFVEGRNFGARRLRSVLIDRRQNINLILQTTNITNISYSNHLVHNDGPSYDRMAQQSEHAIGRYKLNRRLAFDDDASNRHSDHLNSRIEGDSLSVFAAPFDGESKTPPKQMANRIDRVEIDHGWKDTGSDEEIAEARTTMRGKVKRPEYLSSKPAFEKPQSSPEPESTPRGDKNRTEKGQHNESSAPKATTPPMPKETRIKATDRPPNPDEKPAKTKRPDVSNPPSKNVQPEPTKEPRHTPKIEPRAEPRMRQPQEPKRAKSKPDPGPERTTPQKSDTDSHAEGPKAKKAKAKDKDIAKPVDR